MNVLPRADEQLSPYNCRLRKISPCENVSTVKNKYTGVILWLGCDLLYHLDFCVFDKKIALGTEKKMCTGGVLSNYFEGGVTSYVTYGTTVVVI